MSTEEIAIDTYCKLALHHHVCDGILEAFSPVTKVTTVFPVSPFLFGAETTF